MRSGCGPGTTVSPANALLAHGSSPGPPGLRLVHRPGARRAGCAGPLKPIVATRRPNYDLVGLERLRAAVGTDGLTQRYRTARSPELDQATDSEQPGVVPFARLDPRRSPRSGCWLISRSGQSPPLQSRGLAPTGFERPGLVEAAQATAASAPSCEVCLRGTMRRGHGDRLSRAARTALHRPVSLSSTAHTPGA